MKNIFLTGASGILGSALVSQFLEEEEVNVYILIRAESEKHFQERVVSLKWFWADQISSGAYSRLHILWGDVAKKRMGLSSEIYRDLAEKITHIVHSASSINLRMKEERAYKEVFLPFENILLFADMCQSHRFEKLEYISTVGVSGNVQGLIEEEFLKTGRSFRNAYEKVKADIELLVEEKIRQGMAITVHRPSMIVGDSKNGKIISFKGFYFLIDFFSGKLTGGYIPLPPKMTLDLIPVDYVAKTICLSTFSEDTSGGVLHNSSGEGSVPISIFSQEVRNFLQEQGVVLPKLKIIPLCLYKLLIKIMSFYPFSKNVRKFALMLQLFLKYMDDDKVFDNVRSKQFLCQNGIAVPSYENFLKNIFLFYHQSGKS